MKFNEKNFKIVIILLMLVVFVVSFRFVYSNFNDKKEAEDHANVFNGRT